MLQEAGKPLSFLFHSPFSSLCGSTQVLFFPSGSKGIRKFSTCSFNQLLQCTKTILWLSSHSLASILAVPHIHFSSSPMLSVQNTHTFTYIYNYNIWQTGCYQTKFDSGVLEKVMNGHTCTHAKVVLFNPNKPTTVLHQVRTLQSYKIYTKASSKCNLLIFY